MTVYVQRKGGQIVGVYSGRQHHAQEPLSSDHPDVLAFREECATRRTPIERFRNRAQNDSFVRALVRYLAGQRGITPGQLANELIGLMVLCLALIFSAPASATPPLDQWLNCENDTPWNGNIKRKTGPKCFWLDDASTAGTPVATFYVQEAALFFYDADIDSDDAGPGVNLRYCPIGHSNTFTMCMKYGAALFGHPLAALGLDPTFSGTYVNANMRRLMRGAYIVTLSEAITADKLGVFILNGVAQMPGGP